MCSAVDRPMVGSAIYALNVSSPIVGMMVRGHVYSDPAFLSGRRKAEKGAVTKAAGARHASIRFVTGRLDRLQSRGTFLHLVEAAPKPLLLVYGKDAPPKSRAEMEAASRITGIETFQLKHGRLSIHEEFADLIAPEIVSFLTGL